LKQIYTKGITPGDV